MSTISGAGVRLQAARVVAVFAGACVAGILAASCTTTSPGGTTTQPAVQLVDCTVQGVRARCGTVPVFEDRLSRTGRLIDLRVVVVPASASPAQPDPVVYFAGGPGDAATDHVSDVVTVRGGHNRDFVFVDQRGTGGSHKLVCPPARRGVDLDNSADFTRYVASCLRTLDGDPRFYTTALAADDVADVLRQLGYRQVNLYGGSYGATIAQVFLRRHPDLVRTTTLLGGTLLDIPIYNRLAATSQAALDDVLSRCTAEPSCRARFPHVRAELPSLLSELPAAPVTAPGSAGEPFVLTRDLFAAALHQLLLSADTAAEIPLLIHSLATATDRAKVVAAYAARFPTLLNGDSELLAMAYTIRCSEPWARFSAAEVSAAGTGSYYLGNALANAASWQRACAIWPRAGTAADYGPATVSRTPVLMLNGAADPQDPPANMAGAARLWPNSLEVHQPHQSHGTSQWACPESIVDAFIDQGTIRGLDTSCVASVTPPPFVTTF